jgi:hypothetical protein
VFTQLFFFPVAIAVGTAFSGDLSRGGPGSNKFGEHLLDLLTVLSLVMGCFWIYCMKGLRWLSASLVILQETLLVGGFFIAGMAVTGCWI